MKKLLFLLACFSVAVSSACSTSETTNTNIANETNAAVKVDQANMPPGFSTSPLPMSANSTPGIPAPNDTNANKIPMGNVPGIPDSNQAGKTPQPKKTPPIPGIPDDATIRKQMNTPLKDLSIVNNPPKSAAPDANSRPANKRQNPPKP